MENEQGTSPKFNSSFAKIEIMAKLERSAHEWLIRGNLIDAFSALLQLEVELEYKFEDTEITALNSLKDTIVKCFGSSKNNHLNQTVWSKVNKSGTGMTFGENSKNFHKTKFKLINFMKELKRLKSKYGLDMGETDDFDGL